LPSQRRQEEERRSVREGSLPQAASVSSPSCAPGRIRGRGRRRRPFG